GYRARHGILVLAGRPHLGNSLGPGGGARRATRAAAERMGQALQPRAVRMILEVEAVDTFYGETQALFGASLAVESGKVFALLGANGAGKTTMLRSILGLTRPRRGAIRFDGREVTHSPTHEIARDRKSTRLNSSHAN